ncbi:MAG TPA: cytochrome c biogenesis protein CcdA, partial [Thermoanaerobaculia bacterium]|nr:cytochrome c biogenesis protein CcdA [Thermoanaerobaculia bacterium]
AQQTDLGFPGSQVPGAPTGKPLVALAGAVYEKHGDEVRGVITATIEPSWHINSNKPLDSYTIATTVTLDPATAELVNAEFPPHEIKTFKFSAGTRLAVFEGTLPVRFTARLKSGATKIGASLRYQACNDSVCLPPKTVTADIATNVVAATAAAPAAGNFTPLSSAPKNAQASSLLSSDIGATFASQGLLPTLAAIFLLGLLLNLTPCVYPLIPITIGFFARQGNGSRAHRVALSATYVIGIAITYSALGVFSALSGRLFGAWLQLPAVLIFFAVLMLVMASSMFGAFEITVPHFISDRSGGRAGLAGALTMGLLIGIVAAPCVGPFVISLIGLVAQLGNPLLGFLMFFVLALGLGVPYLVLGIFSSALTAMPRSGMWMVQVKKAMGFVLIAMAFYFLRPIAGETVFKWGVAGSLLVGALFLLIMRSAGPAAGNRVRIACGVLLLAAGVAFAIPDRTGAIVRWDAYDAKSLAAAATAKKPAIIDFYADWCLPCKELDKNTFSDAKVAERLGHFIRLKADLTKPEDPATKALAAQYGIAGVPTIVLLDATGAERKDLRLTGYEPPEKFLARIEQVR